jgi:hypothetical protein
MQKMVALAVVRVEMDQISLGNFMEQVAQAHKAVMEVGVGIGLVV